MSLQTDARHAHAEAEPAGGEIEEPIGGARAMAGKDKMRWMSGEGGFGGYMLSRLLIK